MELLITIAFVYSIGFLTFIVINAFLAGYTDIPLSKQDLIEAVMWPLTIVMLIGTIARIIIKK